MEIIFDKLYVDEFFDYGGFVIDKNDNKIIDRTKFKESIIDSDDIKECKMQNNNYEYSFGGEMFNYISPYKKIMLSDKDPYLIKNVNFSLIEPDDKRWDGFKEQRLKNGFDDSELWNLDNTIASFIYPRLKRFYDDGNVFGYPSDLAPEKWNEILEKMIDAFRYILIDKFDEHDAEISEGLDLFRKYYFDLWT